jgi:trans-2,3-dihydro-3-hydroxyanthranilate isomerase
METAMPTVEFVTVDVFTADRFAGNPLAVVTDARGLTTGQMQQIATEFGYSESTFVLPPDNPENSARVRIFTPTTEIPFAGHPNVGTAFVLANRPSLFGKEIADRLTFEEIAGPVEVMLTKVNGNVAGATIRVPGSLEVGEEVDAATVAACASIDAADIVTWSHPPVFASVGLPFVVAELQNLDALGRARPNLTAFHEAAARYPRPQADFPIFLYVPSEEDPWRIRARMFAPLDDVPEDPATGSASAALSAFLVTRLAESDARIRITIEQGVEMGRHSIIDVDVAKSGGIVSDVRISGRCVFVMRGSVEC